MDAHNAWTRRQWLQGAVLGTAGVMGSAAASSGEIGQPLVEPPDLSFLKRESLMNADRLRFFMEQAGLDVLVAAYPANVYYLTNHWPQSDRMGWQHSGIAIFSRDPARPLAMVMRQFLYYYTHSPESEFSDRLIFPFTGPVEESSAGGSDSDEEPVAAPPRMKRVLDPTRVSARDQQRIDSMANTQPMSADASWALRRALRHLGLEQARIGIDDPALERVLRERGLGREIRPAENTLRRARLAKTATEIKLIRLAATQNVLAGLAAAKTVRQSGSTRLLRAQFFAEAAARGNAGTYMVIDGTSTEVLDEPLREGMAFSIDCVSTCRYYYGDFGRTVFFGEPAPEIRRATTAIANAWNELRPQLKPGMRFAEIPEIGRASLRRQGVKLNVSFTPHSVGLHHTDHPQASFLDPRVPQDLRLEVGTVLSVDCPALDAGLGATTHLEDLMLITADGAEPLHPIPEPVLMV
jgi:Xaa-Pro aminopeptidase